MRKQYGGMQHFGTKMSGDQVKALVRLRRKFDGKWYNYRRFYADKGEALKAAVKERSYGFFARVSSEKRNGEMIHKLWYRNYRG